RTATYPGLNFFSLPFVSVIARGRVRRCVNRRDMATEIERIIYETLPPEMIKDLCLWPQPKPQQQQKPKKKKGKQIKAEKRTHQVVDGDGFQEVEPSKAARHTAPAIAETPVANSFVPAGTCFPEL
ncbi:hypothetical protein, partial [Klebsiella pneumoniae]|uniref:hypothetical protein n=1 Tax=Klebsiella pneumoniae TaxID=573 RepID=UPI0040554D1B